MQYKSSVDHPPSQTMDLIERIRKNAQDSIRKRTFHQDFDGGKRAFSKIYRGQFPEGGWPRQYFVYICDHCDLISQFVWDTSVISDDDLPPSEQYFNFSRVQLSSVVKFSLCNSALRFISKREYLSCPKRATSTYPCQNQTWPSKRCTCNLSSHQSPRLCGSSSCLICRQMPSHFA